MPGSTEMRFRYVLTGAAGEPRVNLRAPAAVDRLMVIVPDDIEVDFYIRKAAKILEPYIA